MPKIPERKTKKFTLWKIPKKQEKQYQSPVLFYNGEKIGIEIRRINNKITGKLQQKPAIDKETELIHLQEGTEKRGKLSNPAKSRKRKNIRRSKEFLESINKVNKILKKLKYSKCNGQEKLKLKNELINQLNFLNAPEEIIRQHTNMN